MSLLSFPRIYFKGYISWDPCTFNNNDWQEFPTYDATQAALNWKFLATQGPRPDGITPTNFTTTFRPWAITLQEDNNPQDSPPGRRIPAEWNMFGSHDVSFVQYKDKQTAVTGGAIAYGAPASADPLIGQPIAIGSSAKLVDTNPNSFWSSQIYWNTLSVGNSHCGLRGCRQFRMHSRWLNLNRIYRSSKELTQPAASVAACFQTCIPTDMVQFSNGSPGTPTYSPLIAALQQATGRTDVQGVMVRFTAYVNLYFQNGIFNEIRQQPRTYEGLYDALQQAWDAWNKSNAEDFSQFFSQPCYSHIIGAVGVWNDGELASVPVGRFLAATQNSVTPIGSLPDVQPNPAVLGPVVADVDFTSQLISLDLNSTIPEAACLETSTSDLAKADFGSIIVGAQDAAGTFTPLAPAIPYSNYQRSAYEASAGIIDLPFDANSAAAQSLKAGTALLAIQMQGQTTLAEQSGGYSAQTDSRGIYLDEHEQAEFQIALYRGGVPAPGSRVLVAKYSNLGLIATSDTQLVDFTNGSRQNLPVPSGADKPIVTEVTVLTADAKGIATVGIAAQAPGFPVLAFYPFAVGEPLPTPPLALLGPGVPANQMITNAFYATVRVLPFDPTVPAQFIALWNTTHDKVKVWNFIYNRILYVYDMLFSVMLKYVNLGDRAAVEQAVGSISTIISKALSKEDPSAMPVTRDMSDGKRTALLLWCYLVQHNYPATDIDLGVLSQVTTPT
jgi:hypothetical protein